MSSKNRLYTMPFGSDEIDYLCDNDFDHDMTQEGDVNKQSSLHIIINRPDRKFWVADIETLEIEKSNAEDKLEKIKDITLKELASWQI